MFFVFFFFGGGGFDFFVFFVFKRSFESLNILLLRTTFRSAGQDAISAVVSLTDFNFEWLDTANTVPFNTLHATLHISCRVKPCGYFNTPKYHQENADIWMHVLNKGSTKLKLHLTRDQLPVVWKMDVSRGWCLYGDEHIHCETKLRRLKFALIVIFRKLNLNSSRRSDMSYHTTAKVFLKLDVRTFCKKPKLHVTKRIVYYTTQTDKALFSFFIGFKRI